MMNKVVYERNMMGAFMKLPAETTVDNLDERILMNRSLRGILPVECCYQNGEPWYWYNITGKQSLDIFCEVDLIDAVFFKKLVSSLLDELEILEWSLLDSNRLYLNPAFIFVQEAGKEIFFIIGPEDGTSIQQKISVLFEYLISKIDHKDQELVQFSYQLHQISTEDECNIEKMKQLLLESSMRSVKKAEKAQEDKEIRQELTKPDVIVDKSSEDKKLVDRNKFLTWIYEKLDEYIGMGSFCERRFSGKRSEKREKKSKQQTCVIYPDTVVENEPEIFPTICLQMGEEQAQGLLIYEGREDYENMDLSEIETTIGKGEKNKYTLHRGTVSKRHAKITHKEDGYYLEDLNSTNGTYVNEIALQFRESRKLMSGDIVRFADVQYRFV